MLIVINTLAITQVERGPSEWVSSFSSSSPRQCRQQIVPLILGGDRKGRYLEHLTRGWCEVKELSVVMRRSLSGGLVRHPAW